MPLAQRSTAGTVGNGRTEYWPSPTTNRASLFESFTGAGAAPAARTPDGRWPARRTAVRFAGAGASTGTLTPARTSTETMVIGASVRAVCAAAEGPGTPGRGATKTATMRPLDSTPTAAMRIRSRVCAGVSGTLVRGGPAASSFQITKPKHPRITPFGRARPAGPKELNGHAFPACGETGANLEAARFPFAHCKLYTVGAAERSAFGCV